jgi:hypothetical protein
MTLFANSGVAWPKHEPETKDAGAKSLDAASGLFRILATLEAGPQSPQSLDYELARCVESLNEAARIYASVGDSLAGEVVRPLTPSEFELAALPRYQRRYIDDDFYDRRFPYRGAMPIGELYADLAHRLSRLASSIKTLKTSERSFDLAPQVFEILKLWESVSTLSRLIATLGRRDPQVGG